MATHRDVLQDTIMSARSVGVSRASMKPLLAVAAAIAIAVTGTAHAAADYRGHTLATPNSSNVKFKIPYFRQS